MEYNVIIKKVPRQQQYKEILLNNIVDKDLQALLRPLDVMQNIFICAKYSIRDNFITSNKPFYKYLSLFCAFGYLGGLIYLLVTVMEIIASNPFYLSISLRMFYQFCTCFVGYFINSISNIIHCNNNVLLVLKIQNIKNNLKIDRSHLKSVLIFNWLCVININILYIIEKMDFSERFSFDPVGLIVEIPFIFFEVNIVYATFVIKLLRNILIVWVQRVTKPTREESQRKDYWDEMFQVYSDILEAYNLFQATFRLIITFQTIFTISYSLMTVSILIEINLYWGDGTAGSYIFIVPSVEWLVKKIVLLTFLCNECLLFYDVMDKTQHIHLMFMESAGVSDAQIRMLKNIQRLQRASFKKMSAYGLFVVDATLPLQLAGIISTYTIAQLQLRVLHN